MGKNNGNPMDVCPPDYTPINNLNDLAESMGINIKQSRDKIKRLIEKSVYKGTSCGAWITFTMAGVRVGSIVEGTDVCTETRSFVWGKFTDVEFWNALTQIEEQADEIWNATHGCQDCNMDGAINPDCKTCHGEGAIF